MAAQSSINLADGQATPVSHTFEPNGAFSSQEGVIKSAWIDRGGYSIDLGRAVIREDHRPSVNGSREKIRYVVEVPVVATVNGVLTRVRLHVVDVEFRLDPGAAYAERADLDAFARNLIGSAYVGNKVRTGERTW